MTRRRVEDLAQTLTQAALVRRGMFRLEVHQDYDVSYEQDAITTFLREGRVDLTPGRWQQLVAGHVAAGRTCERVHVVHEPLTDYLRYELAGPYTRSAAAGERIGILALEPGRWPPPGWPPDTARTDFWLFDDEVWTMHYDPAGRFTGIDVDDDPPVLAHHHRVAQVALAAAVPLATYQASDRASDPAGYQQPSTGPAPGDRPCGRAEPA